MRLTGKFRWSVVFALSLFVGGGSVLFAAGTSAQTVNLPAAASQNQQDDDDDVPEVTSRVARISFINGEAKIRRADSKDWEKAALNLPVVEGDEIATDVDSHIEIQFDKHQHLRLAENSYLKIVNLKDDGIAVSLSLGSMNLRITSFNKDKSFFEIDAPKTTLAIQRSGSYRIDAGKEGDTEIRIAATDGGEARVYSDNAGFTVKNGRTARIFIDGANAGEWEAADASRFADDFDRWSAERDAAISRRLADAYYDKYYDDDIYGADDLNGNGEWINTPDYGHVWRPYSSAINIYDDWSPYRYGHWRWIPPFGWTWVNDEPWGWATYHHGRWFYYNGYWVWSPYGYYRPTRSWWQPALVYISIVSDNIYWYPLNYHHLHCDFNWQYHRDHSDRSNRDNRFAGKEKGRPPLTPTGPPRDVIIDKIRRNLNGRKPPVGTIPDRGVVAIGSKDFGSKSRIIRKLPPGIVRDVLSHKPDNGKRPDMPIFTDVAKRVGRDIITDKPRVDMTNRQIRVGAAPRKTDKPLDNELRTTRVFGGREPRTERKGNNVIKGDSGSFEPRKIGAIDRPPVVRKDNNDKQVRPSIFTPREKPRDDTAKPKDSPRITPPFDNGSPRINPTTRKPPQTDTPKPKDSPRFELPPERERPRNDPPKPKDTPRSEKPPEREKPRNDTPKPKDNPPPKSEPKPENKPAPKVSRKENPNGGNDLL